jgi:hypothetical protein
MNNPSDRQRYSTAPDPALELHPPPKRSVAERKEQGQFANYLLLKGNIPFCWHSTHTRSKASPGTPDFWVGVNRHSMWIEFKRDYSCQLTAEQESFRQKCEVQQIEWHLVYSAGEAIRIVEAALTEIPLSDIL